jgi:hypothetical protein
MEGLRKTMKISKTPPDVQADTLTHRLLNMDLQYYTHRKLAAYFSPDDGVDISLKNVS